MRQPSGTWAPAGQTRRHRVRRVGYAPIAAGAQRLITGYGTKIPTEYTVDYWDPRTGNRSHRVWCARLNATDPTVRYIRTAYGPLELDTDTAARLEALDPLEVSNA